MRKFQKCLAVLHCPHSFNSYFDIHAGGGSPSVQVTSSEGGLQSTRTHLRVASQVRNQLIVSKSYLLSHFAFDFHLILAEFEPQTLESTATCSTIRATVLWIGFQLKPIQSKIFG